MSKTTRTFIALPLPDPLKAKLERLQRLIAPSVPGAQWVAPEEFHLTLAFLGDVEDIDLSRVCTAVTDAVRDQPINIYTIKSLGGFPDMSRPRVLWAGIAGDIDALTSLQARIFEATENAGYRPDAKFHAHITIARVKLKRDQTLDLTALEAHYRAWAAGVFTADTVITYSSNTHPDGPRYSPLGIAPLGPPNKPR